MHRLVGLIVELRFGVREQPLAVSGLVSGLVEVSVLHALAKLAPVLNLERVHGHPPEPGEPSRFEPLGSSVGAAVGFVEVGVFLGLVLLVLLLFLLLLGILVLELVEGRRLVVVLLVVGVGS